MKTKPMLAVLLSALLCVSCSDPSGATKTLKAAGYTDIRTQGYAMFNCGQDDTFSTKFTAKNPAGKRTTGVVCSGFMKGGTIRH